MKIESIECVKVEFPKKNFTSKPRKSPGRKLMKSPIPCHAFHQSNYTEAYGFLSGTVFGVKLLWKMGSGAWG